MDPFPWRQKGTTNSPTVWQATKSWWLSHNPPIGFMLVPRPHPWSMGEPADQHKGIRFVLTHRLVFTLKLPTH